MALTIGESSSSSTPYTSSSTPKLCTYHVFLSFRGEDTRTGFTDHLYAALERKGITTFRDDKYLERGQVISKELIKAIQESMFAITILSQDYASSTWCLDELQKIMECNNNGDLDVFPVFYGVDPSDVRNQRGSYEEAFRKHQEKPGQHSDDRVKKWRDALTRVAGYSGWDSKNQHEAELVEIIAQRIHEKLVPKLPSCTENLVGIASKVEEVKKLIGMRLNDVRFIGIWGMGGIGKTTIARAVFEEIRGEFEVTCFLDNVRQVYETKGLVHIQRQLLSHLSTSKNDFRNLYDGKKTIQNSLCRKKVLLVLDDVNDVKQLENLAGKQDWFGPGSRVLITTRDKHMLITHGIHKPYEVVTLPQKEALNLFCLKAFKGNKPQEGYLDLSKKVVDYSGGLPLALEVLGSHLYGRNIDVWHSAVKKLTSVPHRKIIDNLMISYEGLDSMERNIFLDIACFFKGKPVESVIDILENCGYSAQIVIDVLVERSLITIRSFEFYVGILYVVEMHDLLQQMGRDIVIQESDDPSRRSRLWSRKDIDYVMTKNKGTEKINSIYWNYPDSIEGWSTPDSIEEGWSTPDSIEGWSTEAFSNMSQLKFLSLDELRPVLPLGLSCLPSSLTVVHWAFCLSWLWPVLPLGLSCLPSSLKVLHWAFCLSWLWPVPLGLSCLPSSLKVLHWRGCPLKTLPLTNQSNELVDINLLNSAIEQLWQGIKFMENLKYLNLSDSENLKCLPDLSGAPNLEKVILKSCRSLTKIHPSLVRHKKVVLLNFKECESLKSLPGKLEMSSLKVLDISGCPELCRFLDGLKELKCLEELYADDIDFNELPSYIFHLNNIKVLSFRSTSVFRFPPSVWSLPSLKKLNLGHCGLSEESIPDYFWQLPSLVSLDISANNFVSIPSSIFELPKLKFLALNGCKKLEFLPELPFPSSIIHLDAAMCDALKVSKIIPAKLYSISEEFESTMEGICLPTPLEREMPRKFVHHGTSNCFSTMNCLPTARFDMVIPGNEIPSWFVNHGRTSSAKIQVPNNCPVDQWVGFALCFLLEHYAYELFDASHNANISCYLLTPNGKKLVSARRAFRHLWGRHLYILYLSIDQLRDKIDCWSDIEFTLNLGSRKLLGFGSRLVCKKEVEDWKSKRVV